MSHRSFCRSTHTKMCSQKELIYTAGSKAVCKIVSICQMKTTLNEMHWNVNSFKYAYVYILPYSCNRDDYPEEICLC